MDTEHKRYVASGSWKLLRGLLMHFEDASNLSEEVII
jgi:hypothetical protein